MNGKRTSFAWFGLGAVFAVSLVLVGAQNGPLNRVFAAPPVVMPTSGLHAFAAPGCTHSDLVGLFGLYRIGATDVPKYTLNPMTNKYSVKPLPVPVAPFSNPLAAIGIIYFDGAGNGYSYQRESREGNWKPIVPGSGPDAETQMRSTYEQFAYSVDTDCTFLTYSHTTTGDKKKDAKITYVAQGVILGNEDEFYMMSLTPPGGAVVVVAKKLPPQAFTGI